MNPYILMTRLDTSHSARNSKLSVVVGGYLKNKTVALAALFLILGGFYIFQINQLAVLGYDIKESEKNNVKLQKEVTQLQIDVEKMKAGANLQARTKYLNMVESQGIEYLYVSDSGLALGGNSRY